MLTQTHWKETFDYQPWNPAQKATTHYTGLPGGYSTFYYNQIPNTTTLMGPELPQIMNPGSETLTVVPQVYGLGALPEGQFSMGQLALFASIAALLGAAAGYSASRML